MQFPPRKYSHPFNTPEKSYDKLGIKFWEIRNQLEINIELMIQNCPVDDMTMKIFGHPIEVSTGHVFDRLNELEAMIKELKNG